jgi:branched-chain amino acid transport system permease protein
VSATFFFQLLLNGLTIGIIYALVASGLSLVFGVLNIVNFAHGEFYMIGAMLAYFAATGLGFSYWPMVAVVVVTAFCIGIVLSELLLSRLQDSEIERSVLATLGLAMVIQNGAIFLFTTTPRAVRSEYSFEVLSFAGIGVPVTRAIAAGLAVLAFAAVWWSLYRTQTGRAIRGVSQNRAAAFMVGIDPRSVSRLAVAIGIALAGLAGAALAPVYAVHPTMGFAFIFKAFAIVIIGGLGSFQGAIFAALIIGLVESFAGSLLSMVVADALSFSTMLLVLMFRPEGLFGRGVRI